MNLEQELLLDAEHDAQAVAYIQRHLPQELQTEFTEQQLYYLLDLITEYYTQSGVLETQPDAEGYIEIDQEAIAKYLAQKAAHEQMGTFNPQDLLFVVQAEMDFEEGLDLE